MPYPCLSRTLTEYARFATILLPVKEINLGCVWIPQDECECIVMNVMLNAIKEYNHVITNNHLVSDETTKALEPTYGIES